MGVISKFLRKISNKGFTLIEALIATVLVGACIMPIVGTMQNAESMTQRMVNDNKLQMLARSRMNLETSRANNEQKYIDETTGWLYEWYENDGDKFPRSVATYSTPNEFSTATSFSITNMFRVYRIAVKVKDNVILKSEKSDGTMENDADFKGLKQVVVTSQIVGEDGQFYILEDNSLTDNNYPTGNEKYKVDEKYLAEMGSISLNPPPDYVQQYSLVSLVTVPEVSSEYVYALDIKNNAVCSFDPVTGMMSNKYKIPGNKLYQAVFPSPDGKKLFLFGGTDSSVGNIGLFDIDPSSTTYSQFIGEKGSINRTGNSSSLNRENALYKTKYALRPDGNRAYAILLKKSSGSSGSNINGYYADGLKTNWVSCQWFGVDTVGSIYDTATLFLTAGSDGFLYFGPFDDNSIKRHPMYNNTPLNLKFVETAKLPSSVSNYNFLYSAAACVSPDSKIVYTLWHKNDYSDSKIVLFDSLTFSYIKSINLKINTVTEIKVNDMEISADGRFIVLSCIDNDGANLNGKRVAYILKTSLLDNNNLINLDDYKAEFSDSEINSGSEYAIYSKLTGHFIVDNADKPILRSIDYNDILENSPTSGSTATVTHSIAQADSSSIITHHSVRTPEIIYTTSKDENNKYKLKAIDTGLKEFNEEFEIELKDNLTSVALSPNGDTLTEFTKSDSIANKYFFDTYLCEKMNSTNESSNNLFDTNIFLSNKYKNPYSEYEYARAYWRKDITNPLYCHKARIENIEVVFSNDWIVRKIIGTNSGGALILASNSGNTKSLVDWYELKEDKTGFERCGRWVSEGSDLKHFPPYNAIDMAISRDDRVLVFLSEALDGSEYKYYANFFDFGTYNFGNKTQMKGMIVDFRDEDRNLNLTSANPVNGKLRAKEDNGQRIHSGYTVTDSFTNTYDGDSNYSTDFKNNPIKFDESSIKTGSTTPESKIFLGKNKRIFGYYNKVSDNDGSISKVTIASFTPNIKNSLGRVWINNSPFYDNNLIEHLTTYSGPSETGSNTYLIQLDQTASSKIRTDKFCAATDTANILPNNGWKKFDDSIGNVQNIELCSGLQDMDNYIDILNRVAWSSSDEVKLANFAEIIFGTVTNKLDVETALCSHIYGRIGTAPDLHPRPGMYFNFYKYIPNGPMDISLLFCEGTYNDHRRVFSVYAEDQCFAGLNDFRPSLEAVSGDNSQSGKYKPIIKNDKVKVKDNRIDIRFTDIYNNPNQDTAGVSAIKLKYYDYDTQDGDESERYGFEGQNADLITPSNSHNLEKSSVTVGDSGTIPTNTIKNMPSWVLSEWPFRKHYETTASNNSMDFEISWKSGMDRAKATIYFMEHIAANNTAGKRVLKLSSDNTSTSYIVDFIKDADNHPPGWVFTKTLHLNKIASNKLKIKFEKISGDKPIFSGIKIDWYGSINYSHVLASASIKLKQNPSTYLDIVETETMPLKFEPFWIGKATNIQRKNNSNVVNFEASRFVEDDGYFYLCSSSLNGSYIKKFTLNDTDSLTANQVEETNCIQNMILSENKPYIYFNYLDGTNNNIYAIKDSLSSSDCEKIATDTDNKANSVILLNKPYNRMKKSLPEISSIATITGDLELPVARYGCNKAVAVNGAIYYVGGDGVSGSDFKKIYKFDPLNKTITNKATFNNNIRNASVAAYDNIIYVFNGSLDSLETNVCAYDVKNDKKIEYVAGNISNTDTVISEYKLLFPLKQNTLTSISSDYQTIKYSSDSGEIVVNTSDQASLIKASNNGSHVFDTKEYTFWVTEKHGSVLSSGSCPHTLTITFPNEVCITAFEMSTEDESDTAYAGPLPVPWNAGYVSSFSFYKIDTTLGNKLTITPSTLTAECQSYKVNVTNSNYYKKYIFSIDNHDHSWAALHELRFFGNEKKQIPNPTPSTLGMSPITDDTLTKITANHGGVCMTPYGILRAGGEGSGTNGAGGTGSSTSQIYWPHAMADYDNERSGNKGTRGLCHSLADIASQTTDTNNWYFKDMSLVYHKGKAYGFGMAKPGVGVEQPKAISYDFDRNEWSYFYISALNRSYAAAVSFGDEIYLFGGIKFSAVGGTPSYPKDGSIIAWNPEKNTVRECGTIGNISSAGVPLSHISACAYGSDIYLFGGLDNDGNPTKKIYKFTP